MKVASVFFVLFFALLIPVQNLQAQVEVNDEEMERRGQEVETGKGAAQGYFLKRQQQNPSPPAPTRRPLRQTSSASDRYLTLHVGTFFNEGSYKWGKNNQDDVGRFNAGVTYKVGEWIRSMDLLFRAEYLAYKLNEGRANKLSLVPLITFPDANSRFPLYFGGGAGLGVFFKQIKDESNLSLDFQLVAGARIFDLIDNLGILFEGGLKNHILLSSDGQFNSLFFSVGMVFQF